MIAGIVLSNLLYLVGAIVAATVVSGIVLLRHRRPKSLEAGIEMFSRELKALEPDRRGPGMGGTGRVIPSGPTREGPARGGRSAIPGVRTGGNLRAGGPVRPFPSEDGARGASVDQSGGGVSASGRDGARAPSPDRENEPG